MSACLLPASPKAGSLGSFAIHTLDNALHNAEPKANYRQCTDRCCHLASRTQWQQQQQHHYQCSVPSSFLTVLDITRGVIFAPRAILLAAPFEIRLRERQASSKLGSSIRMGMTVQILFLLKGSRKAQLTNVISSQAFSMFFAFSRP